MGFGKERFDRYVRSERDLEEKFNDILRNPWEARLSNRGEGYAWVWSQDDALRKGVRFGETRTSSVTRGYPEGRQCGDGPRYRPQIIVGTHALLYENVTFSNLRPRRDRRNSTNSGWRSGGKLYRAREPAPDVLVMTATPIPRTLTMTIYGDLEVSTIDEMPRGRVKLSRIFSPPTNWAKRLHSLRQELTAGRQAYIIYPLIDESEKLDAKAAAKNSNNGRNVCSTFRCELLHGRVSFAR